MTYVVALGAALAVVVQNIAGTVDYEFS